jgi:PAS domain S-box-containing protein
VLEEKKRNEVVLQKKYQSTLQEKKQTSAVLESIAEGLVVVNNKGEVVMMNPAATKLLAVKPQDGVGKPILDTLQDKQLMSLVRGSKDEDREIVLSAKQETTKRILRASNAVISDENGSTIGMVSVLSDVTKQREIDQMKSEFVSKVSHELRTPIVAMQHALSILFDQVAGPLTEEQQKFVNLTQRNLERLSHLINDLLDLSKLEAKKMELRPQPTQIGPVIQTVCDSLEPWAKTKAITLMKRVDAGLPDVPCDQARITQVLTNLAGNAIKFTPKQGKIVISAKLAEGQDALEVSVTDNGVGIAEADLPKLFGKFQQVGERTASDISGTGLGLAISKEIVELHKGRIWAESKLQQGTRFVFTLPLASAHVLAG